MKEILLLKRRVARSFRIKGGFVIFQNSSSMNWLVGIGFFLFAAINLLLVSFGAARLAGVYTKRIATATTLFNTYVFFSRIANMLLLPEIGRLADIARKTRNIHLLGIQYRIILSASTLGCVLAFFLIPTFVEVFRKGILVFERENSVPKIFLGLLNPKRARHLYKILTVSLIFGFGISAFVFHHYFRGVNFVESLKLFGFGISLSILFYVLLTFLSWLFHPEIFRPPGFMGVTLKSLSRIPHDFLILNIFVQAFLTIGVLAAYYAGAVESGLALTAVGLSGIITGVSTILFTIFVDPKAALITDQAIHGVKTEEDVKAVIVFLNLGSIVGTLVAQLLFEPAAWLIMKAALRV